MKKRPDNWPPESSTDQDVIHVPTFDIPISSFLTPDERQALRLWTKWHEQLTKACPYDKDNVPAVREYWDQNATISIVERFNCLYDVRIDSRTISGIRTEVVSPTSGVSSSHR